MKVEQLRAVLSELGAEDEIDVAVLTEDGSDFDLRIDDSQPLLKFDAFDGARPLGFKQVYLRTRAFQKP